MDTSEVYVEFSLAQRIAQSLSGGQPAYAAKVKEFLDAGTVAVQKATSDLLQVFAQYADTHDYYGEDTTVVGAVPDMIEMMWSEKRLVEGVQGYNIQVPNFFTTIVQFISLYKKAVEDNKQKERIMNAKKAREVKGNKSKAKSKLTKKSAVAAAPKPGAQEVLAKLTKKSDVPVAPVAPESPVDAPAAPPKPAAQDVLAKLRAKQAAKQGATPAQPAAAPAAPAALEPEPAPAAPEPEPPKPEPPEPEPPAAAPAPAPAAPKKNPLQQQIAMKAALKLKQMKAAKAAKKAAAAGK